LAVLDGVGLVLALAVFCRGVILVCGGIFVGLFLFFHFVSCQMQQKVKNGLNKKKDDPVKRE
jgi:hypothetical protein